MSMELSLVRKFANTSVRFWEKVRKDDKCWEWQSWITKDGYGQFCHVGRPRLAHRMSWVLSFGDIPDGKCVLHRCDNRRCVRPSHLFLGTKQDNNLDKAIKGRSLIGEKNPNCRFSDQDVKRIKVMSNSMTRSGIARIFGTDASTISRIVLGKRRARVGVNLNCID